MLAHHVDFDRYNNNPENILAMEIKAHFYYHSQNAKKLNERLTKLGRHPFQNLTKEQLLKRAETKKKNGDYEGLINSALEYMSVQENRERVNEKHSQTLNENREYYEPIWKENLEKAQNEESIAKAVKKKRENGY